MNKPLIWAFLLLVSRLSGQTYLMNGAPIAGCSGTFYDIGGSAGNYTNNQNLSTTICPDNGLHLRLDFSLMDLAAGDQLCFFDGATVLAPPIACASDFPAGQPFTVAASTANMSGCLTLSFVSDNSVTAQGWVAALSCFDPCLLPAPSNVQVVSMTNGNMVWTWNSIPGASSFEVSLNGGPWQPASGALSHTVTGLNPGDLVVLEIRVFTGIPNCVPPSITVNKTYVNCTLDISATALAPATCAGASTGSATIGATGAMGAVQFFADGSVTPNPNGNFLNVFAAGLHSVVAKDAAGCLDTVGFSIAEPAPVVVTDSVTDVTCFGDDNGRIKAKVTGGTAPYTYAWQGCQGGAVIPDSIAIDLFAGCYAVTVSDKNGCTATAQDSIHQPPMYVFSSSQDSVRCFGGTDGMATVVVSGAVPPYTYKWGNGDTTPMADSLKAAYHSVTVTDVLGCKAVTFVQVLEPPQLIIDSISIGAISCFGNSDGVAKVFAHGGIKPYTYQWNVPGSGSTLSGLSGGAYTVTVSDINGCSAVSSTMLSTPADISVQITGLQAETCPGACNGKFQLNASGGTGGLVISWSSPAIPPGTSMPQNLCPGTYTATVIDSKGCSKFISAAVKAAAPIKVQFAAVPPACAGDQNGTLAATASGGTAPFTFLWNTGATGGNLSNLSCGVFQVTATDSLGCTTVASDTLPCPAALVLDSIVPKPVRCFGEANGQVNIAVHGGSGTLSYLWSDPNQQFNPIAVGLPKGLYTVTVSDANGCSLTASATIQEPEALSATITATPVTCFGGNDGTATALPIGGTTPYSFSWNVPQTTQTITGLTANTYFLTLQDAAGCKYTGASVQINQPATAVKVSTNAVSKACFGAANGAGEAIAAGSNGAPYTYQWSNNATLPQPVNFSAGTYTVTATDPLGCTGTQTLSIEQWDSIHVNVVLIQPTCSGTSNGQAYVNLVTGGAGAGTFDNYHFVWSAPGMPDTIYIGNLPGNKTYTLTITDNSGCSAVFDYFLAAQDSIRAELQADSVSCAGLADGAIQIVNIESSRPIAKYDWNNGRTDAALTNIPAGSFTVTLTDQAGCTGTASTIVYEPTVLNLHLDVKALVCNSDSNGAVRAIVQGGNPIYSYTWNTGASGDQVSGLGPGNYRVTVTDQRGCIALDSTTLVQPNPPAINAEITQPACFGSKDGLVHLVVTGGVGPYRYSLDNQAFTGSSVFLGLGAGSYMAFVKDGKGCVTTTTFQLNQPVAVEASLGPERQITVGDSVVLSPDIFNAVGSTSYTWRSALIDSLLCLDPPECSSIQVQPAYSNTYFVTVTDANGCRGETQVQVLVEKPRGVHVPTAFSPNGDGANDLLVVYGKSRFIKQVNVFRVYDRWGELVYEDLNFPPNQAQRGWDGRFRGSDCQTGAYVWYVEVEYGDGYIESERGNTTLIR